MSKQVELPCTMCAPQDRSLRGLGIWPVWTSLTMLYLVIVGGYCYWSYLQARERLIRDVDEHLRVGTAAFPGILPDDYHDRAVAADSIAESEYRRVIDKLTQYAKKAGFQYAYTAVSKDGKVHLTATSTSAEEREKENWPEYFEHYYDAPPELQAALDTEETRFAEYADRWGQFRSVFVPVRTPGGRLYVAAMDYNIDHVSELLHGEMLHVLATGLVSLVAVAPLFFAFLWVTRRQAARLRQSEQRFRSVVEDLPALVCRNRPDGTILFVNNAYCKYFGKKREELVGCDFFGLIPESDRDYVRENLLRLSAAEPIMVHEHKVIAADGSVRHHRWTNRAICNRAGKVVSLQAYGEDITERKRVQESLHESEQFLRSILDSLAANIALVDHQGQILLVNEAWKEFARQNGISPELVSEGTNYLQACDGEGEDAEEADPFAAGIRSVLSGERPSFSLEYHCHTPDRPWWFLGHVTPLPGSGPRRVVIAHEDITERKLAEQALRESEEKYRTIFEQSNDGILLVRDVVTECNDAAARILRCTKEDIIGKAPADLSPPTQETGEDSKQLQDEIWAKAYAGQPQRFDWQCLRSDGEIVELDVHLNAVTMGGVSALMATGRDMTDRVRIEEMMVQSEKMLSVGGLAAGMAHEINNPLAGMMQTASVLNDRLGNLELPANQRAAEEAGISMATIRSFMDARGIFAMLANIRESGRRAAEIVANMLSFARRSDSTFSPHDLADLLDQTVDLAGSEYDLKKKYDFRQIEIVRQYEDDLPEVPCEAGKIQQVLLNVLRNGAEAMQEPAEKQRRQQTQGEKPRFILRLSSEKEAGRVRIEIEDNGPGMDEVTRRRVFEPFFTTKSADRGTGLGLSVSYFIITESHRGEMGVHSRPEHGTKFIIKLPVTRRES